jgi:peptide-methionine (S)-S-oxide reductase
VVRTRVGYSGGTKPNPTYRDLGDQSETVQIDYDPRKLSYEKLLQVFWQSHDPGAPAWSRQYRAAAFYHNDEQKNLALKTRDQVAARLKGRVFTEILPASRFYPAEDYHQKYFLRQVPELFREFAARYPRPEDLVASTAAARVNGYVAGYGSLPGLQAELPGLGLSEAGANKLLSLVRATAPSGASPGCPLVR